MSFENPTDEELRVLAVLINVCCQYMPGSFTYVEHTSMSAGEHAVHLLDKYGLVVRDGAGGCWTTKANMLERLDDVNLSNLDEIRSKFRALPEGELLTVQPGDRPHKHDVQLGHLRLWVPARAIDKYDDLSPAFGRPGADRLDVEARIDLVDAMASIKGEILTVGEVQAFRDQLAGMMAGSNRSAKLDAYKDCLRIDLSITRDGMVGGKITITIPNYRHSTTTDLGPRRIDFLKGTIGQFDQVLSKLRSSD